MKRAHSVHSWIQFLVLCALMLVMGAACTPAGLRKEITDARAALSAAREAGVDTESDEYKAAEGLLNQALAKMRAKQYGDAQGDATAAKSQADDLLNRLMEARKRGSGVDLGSDLIFDPGAIGSGGRILLPGDAYTPDERLTLKRIYFRFDDYTLTDEARDVLDVNARWLIDHPEFRIQIEGHCDERGTNEYNLALGERRAASAQTYFAALGVDPSRLRIISYGEEIPLDADSTEEAYARNRRVQFVRITDPVMGRQ